jgi:uncharacterized membrane protein
MQPSSDGRTMGAISMPSGRTHPMDDDAKKHLFVLGYPDRAAAEAAVTELHELQRDQFLEVKDWAIVSKADGGELTVTESKDADPGARRGAVAGGLGGAFIALAATPIGAGAILAGAGIGAVASRLRDAGFKSGDLGEVGRLMQDGRAVLLLAVRPQDTDRLRGILDDVPELRAADRRWEAVVDQDSKNVLRDAIAAYRAEHEEPAEPLAWDPEPKDPNAS